MTNKLNKSIFTEYQIHLIAKMYMCMAIKLFNLLDINDIKSYIYSSTGLKSNLLTT